MIILIPIPDLHLGLKFENRLNYLRECSTNLKSIEDMIESVQDKYPHAKIRLILLGDVFHKGEKKGDIFNMWVQRLTLLRSKVSGIDLVMGNHEITYSKDNPFWSLIKNVNSSYISNLKLVSLGMFDICTLNDHLDITTTDSKEYRLHFVHYGKPIPDLPDNKINLGFFHDYYMSREMFNSLEVMDGGSIQKKYMNFREIREGSILEKFRMCCFGHMHRIQGIFDIEWDSGSTTNMFYMGSVGLTNKDEVLNTPDTRTLPIIKLEAGKEVSYERFSLPICSGRQLLKMDVVEKNIEKYEHVKERQSIKQTVFSGEITNPVEMVKENLESCGDLLGLKIFECLKKEGGEDSWLDRKINKITH